ncbi:MAG: HesB/IscA family protein [Alphaproteobacteria bacterium]|uniref:Iron-sulfur cluster assembly accessory protein n=1 Tax=PS1 clade bacterium TaxID=2175152 RepID=A0A368DPW5_9PROT|nr:Fe-S cluster assembly scaffold SufA [Rhodobiaceae bacterium]OUT73768.1 MAG: Fe-S cluster assembly scaffold SufA [Rhizobiales bacterium TMED25]RCL73694.1 MAG: iron-sulfur cluster assembly accessory protein [PS1 clade bacterium]|tara:strand:- start:7297 stop:7674 length:378 start_codon:yes stop_codon:yes gene_type:complete
MQKSNILTLTPKAIERIRYLVNQSSSQDNILRVGIEKGGCAGLTYSMDYISEIKEGDEIVDQDDIKVVVDPKAILYLLGTEMDYVEDKFSSGFKFNNPNEVSACGCGESVEIVPLDTVTEVSTAS